MFTRAVAGGAADKMMELSADVLCDAGVNCSIRSQTESGYHFAVEWPQGSGRWHHTGGSSLRIHAKGGHQVLSDFVAEVTGIDLLPALMKLRSAPVP